MLFSLYVGHLPINTTKAELMELFAAHKPTEAAVLRREDSQLFAFGFVRFDNPQAMLDAIVEGDWTLHGAQLSVNIAKESRVALRQVTGGTHGTSKAVERDSLVRSRVKEACRVVNKDLDIINGDELLDAHWVLNCMESCTLKYTCKQTGSPDPSALLTYESLCQKIQHGPFTAGGAGVGQRRQQEVMDAMNTELHGLHSKLLQAFAQSPHEAGVYPNRIPKELIQLMTSVGINDSCEECCDEGGSRCKAVLGSKSGADYIDSTEKHDSGMLQVNTQQAAGPQSTPQQKSSSQQHSPSVLLQSPEQARTGKGHFTTSDEHLLSGGASGPGGPSFQKPSYQHCQHLRNPHHPQPFSSEQAVPGGPPYSACDVEDSAPQSDPQAACSSSSGLEQELRSNTSQVCTRLSDGLPSRSHQSGGCHSSSHSHTGVSAVHTDTNRLVSRCFPEGDADLQNTVTDGLGTLHANNRSNSSQRDHAQHKSFSPSMEQCHRSFCKDFQHRAENKKEQKLLKLLGQTGSVSEISVDSRKTGDNAAPTHRIRNPHVLSSAGQSTQWSVEDQELNYVVPEEYKAALESEDAAALRNQSHAWQDLGKANWKFLGKNSIDEEEPGAPASSRTPRKGKHNFPSHNPRVKDLHPPQRLHTAESPSAKLFSRTAEVESTLPDFRRTISSSQSDATDTSEDKIFSSLRGHLSDSMCPGPGEHSPIPPRASPSGVGRGRGAIYSVLLDSLQKRPGERGEGVKRDDDSAPASTGQRVSPALVPGRGRGLKPLQLIKK